VFFFTFHAAADAAAASASRLCLKGDKLATHAGKILLPLWKEFIMNDFNPSGLKSSKKIKEKEIIISDDEMMKLVNSFEDACKLKNISPDSFYMEGDTPDETAYKQLKFALKVLNQDYVFTMSPEEERHYPYFDISSGFVFYTTLHDGTAANAASASRLCLKNKKMASHAGEILLPLWKQFIM
jgi:hypothetical protein